MMIVDIDHLKKRKKELLMINSIDLDEIQFYENGDRVEISKETLEQWKYIGLNNTDFITSGFYKGEMSE